MNMGRPQQRSLEDCERWNKNHDHGDRSSTYIWRCSGEGPYLRCRLKEPARPEMICRFKSGQELWHAVVAVELIDTFMPENMSPDNVSIDDLVPDWHLDKVWNPDDGYSDW